MFTAVLTPEIPDQNKRGGVLNYNDFCFNYFD